MTAFLQGNLVSLRALESGDLLGNYSKWLDDADVCRFNSHATFPNNVRRMQDYLTYAQTTTDAVILAIVLLEDGRHVGNVSLLGIDWIARSAEFAILIGEKDCWGKGVGGDVGRLVVEYGFNRLNLNRIHCGTSVHNQGMRGLAAKLRMRQEGLRRQAMFKLGEYVDIVEYGVLRAEYYDASVGD